MGRRPRPDVLLSCNYLDNTQGLAWDIKVSFTKRKEGFEVWAFERNVHVNDFPWRFVSLLKDQPLSWRTICKYFLEQDDLHVWGDLWSRVAVEGLEKFESDMVLMAFIIDEEVPDTYRAALKLMIGFSDEENRRLLESYGHPINLVYGFRGLLDETSEGSQNFYNETLGKLALICEALGMVYPSVSDIREKVGAGPDTDYSELLKEAARLQATSAIKKNKNATSLHPSSVTESVNTRPPQKSNSVNWLTLLNSDHIEPTQVEELIVVISEGATLSYELEYGNHSGWWAVVVWLFQNPNIVHDALNKLLQKDEPTCHKFVERLLKNASSSVSLFAGPEPHRFVGGALAPLGKHLAQQRVLAGLYCQRIADSLGIRYPEDLKIGDLPHWGGIGIGLLNAARGFKVIQTYSKKNPS